MVYIIKDYEYQNGASYILNITGFDEIYTDIDTYQGYPYKIVIEFENTKKNKKFHFKTKEEMDFHFDRLCEKFTGTSLALADSFNDMF